MVRADRGRLQSRCQKVLFCDTLSEAPGVRKTLHRQGLPMRQVLRVTSAAGLLALMAAVAQAQVTFGMAGVLCSQYTKAAHSSDILYHQASQWLLGYVSGMNAAMKVAKGTTPLATFTNDQVLKSTGAYCAANPASNLANAANEWYATVPKQTDPAAVVKDPSDNSMTLSLDRAPARKPLLDRR